MSKLSHYIKLRSGPSGCNAKQFECDKYLDCDSCLEDKIKEHDKQIRADAIDDFANWLVEEFEKKVADMCFCEYHDAFIDAIEIVKQFGVSDV